MLYQETSKRAYLLTSTLPYVCLRVPGLAVRAVFRSFLSIACISSSSVFGLGHKINRPPFSRSGYLSSALHVPHAQRKTISCYELATRTISWHVCGTRWRPLTLFLVIGWYSHCCLTGRNYEYQIYLLNCCCKALALSM